MGTDLTRKSAFSPRGHHQEPAESDTANLAAAVTASIEAAAAIGFLNKSAATIGTPRLLVDDAIDHIININAAESTGVDFTVAGLGQATTANSVLLDTNNCLSPTLSGNAVNPTDVTHTISGKAA